MAGAHLGSDIPEQVQLDCVWNTNGANNNADTVTNSISQDEIVVIGDVQDMCNETVTKLLLKNMTQLRSILENINKDSQDRCFNAYDVPLMQLSSVKQTLITDEDVSQNTDVNHRQLLLKHLASFNLRIDPVSGDGDCAFRSIIVQVQKTQEWNDEESALRLHCLKLRLGKSINEDVFHLRQLFVDSVQSNDYYQMLTGIPISDMNAETERFRDQNSFCGDVGDLVIKVCSDLLRIPIIVVTSLNGTPFVPFIPDDAVTDRAIYIGYTAFGPGHYDGTAVNEANIGLNSKTTNKVCSCGKNNAKDSEKASCTKDDKGHSHCPCVISGIFVPAIVDARGVKTQPCKLLALLQVKLDTPLMFPANVATTK
ncbi:hypothetical protein pdam_00020042 [Pocillopora damicornis]|uniref:OTU domain-containing protein n=1 Tax=Pocillopora damicornis TaxID=46731 RepID=A0A3M6T6Y2_POCDA|nr:hypothetical protein pdam_00020042 [Pocillopora damicornis]